MLVGAGGNAGGQSVVLAVRKLALNLEVDNRRQLMTGIKLAIVLSAATGIRTAIQGITTFWSGLALSIAMFYVVLTAVCLGTFIPQFFQRVGIDPAHASAVIQVTMDIVGISITCTVATIVWSVVDRHNDADAYMIDGGRTVSQSSLAMPATADDDGNRSYIGKLGHALALELSSSHAVSRHSRSP